jgi:small subunit ribosomal protein S20
MANTKASKKDLRQAEKRHIRVLSAKSALKTYIKKVRKAEADKVVDTLKTAVSALDKAAQRGIIHKNQAARRKSRIAKAANAALKA